MKNHHTTVYLGLGSNLGDREANLRRALGMLVQLPNLEVRRISAFLENPAVGGPEDAPPFLNAAVEAITVLSPRILMKRLLEIESEIGRDRRVKLEPRIIDVDLLLYGSTIVSDDDLIIPHPLLHEREFVLAPLAEIAGSAVHPVLQMAVKDLLANLRENKTS